MSSVTDYILGLILMMGPEVLALFLGIAAVGVPLPATMLVIAAGAFVAKEQMTLVETVGYGLVGVISGDMLSFWLGRKTLWLWKSLPVKRVDAAAGMFGRHADWSIFITRFLLTPFATPTNLLAGASGMSWWRFLSLAGVGELVWLVGYGSLGYFFSLKWLQISELVSNGAGLVSSLVVVLVVGWWGWRQRKWA